MKSERERYLAMLVELLVTDTQPDGRDWRVLEIAQMGDGR